MSSVAVLFSGGTDSTLTAAMMADKYEKIYLLTYKRFGVFKVEHTYRAARLLQEKYCNAVFVHEIIDIDKIYSKLSYQQYIGNIFKHGFMNLSTCGLCKLSMHVQTINYCIKYSITNVVDGANKSMDIYPAQMEEVLEEITKLYRAYGILYNSPVFSFASEENSSFISNVILRKDNDKSVSTSECLYERGLTSERYMKGTLEDRKRQARCFQLIILHIYLKKFFLFFSDYTNYRKRSLAFMKDKINYAQKKLIVSS